MSVCKIMQKKPPDMFLIVQKVYRRKKIARLRIEAGDFL